MTTRAERPDFIALIPAYNEAERIEPVIAAARLHLPVVVVDDGSTDQTAALAEAAGATVLRQRPNQGKGAALRAGFAHALDLGCRAVVALDADGQHDPAEIPAFLASFQRTGAALVIGRRRLRHMPLLRRLANGLGRLAFSWAVGRYVPDNQSGYRLVDRRLMAQLLDASEAGFEFELEMIVACLRQGYRLEWVPIETIYRGESSHINNWQHLTNFLRVTMLTRRLMRTGRRKRPDG